MINRSVLILRYKQPFVDWINAADPDPDPDPDGELTLAGANDDSTAYLIEAEDDEELEEWLELNGTLLFEEELNAWYTLPDLWPQDRSLALFREWCAFELHSVVLDTGESPLLDDEGDDDFEP